MSHKYVYFFGDGKADGKADMKNLLGGKGANLAEMTNLGIPVPAGFSISTEVCTYYYAHGESYPNELNNQVLEALRKVEGVMGAKFGDPDNPLLVSVRSGARVSMPGMMDTVLNLGLNDTTVKGVIKQTDNPRFAYDSYRRFVAMYGDVVMGLKPESADDHDPFEIILDAKKAVRGVTLDTELTADELRELVGEFKAEIKKRTGQPFPEDPMDQLWGAVGAVFGSWHNERANVYRKLNKIPEEWGTAVNVQSMVYGNMGEDCGTGVAFTRDPATGENVLYGEYLINAQGEDVVAGTRTPEKISQLAKAMPEIYKEFEAICDRLEKHYGDMQDMEFTIQKGRLWMLQTRTGKRTGFAAFRIAVDLVEEGLISKEEALMRLDPNQLNQLLRPIFDPKQKRKLIDEGNLLTKGLNAGPGAATGKVVFNAPDAVSWQKKGEQVILVRVETSPEDIQGMHAADGILTARGGMTSHAALVGRQMGKVCVVGAGELSVNYKSRSFEVNGKTVKEGDWISIDGSTGEVMKGRLETQPSEVLQVLLDKTLKPEDSEAYYMYSKVMEWADSIRRLRIRTNADQPDQADTAIAFGAEGIGLCRTEHMFFEGTRIDAVREMIVADNLAGREKALAKLLPMQRGDFEGIFTAMDEKPVTIRLLDPPLHEFLPHTEKELEDLAKKLDVSYEKLHARVEALHEFNPMLGHRGCRLGVVYPEITAMQVRAILEAACEVKKKGVTVLPEIMIPLISHVNELREQEQVVRKVAKEVFEKYGFEVEYMVGTMIEIPRAAITADEVATVAEFFSFGTNDLTQTTFGMSRDDSGVFLPFYVEHKILTGDPFESIDQGGVGKLMEWGIAKGRETRPKLKVGICGEHGGEPASVEFCHKLNLDYVSCSPFRVPIARVAAAQAVLRK
ncbi:MAG: pyruvate, phosphate dikinase [Calditrichaeota bacterium]|nr:pyruvate, phosphate dikinase [Calditrichota bacterium]MCB0268031.1 pyruvate, phosphate dikinase [Calditrichota bacterium]